MRGQVNIPVMVVLAIVLPLFAAVGVFWSTSSEMASQIERNCTRIDSQEKQLDRILDKLDTIEQLLRERK